MKNFEVLKFVYEPIKRLKEAGIKLEDVNYIDLFSDYQKMIGEGQKVTYSVIVLSEKYKISERKFMS